LVGTALHFLIGIHKRSATQQFDGGRPL